jgi:tetratricopeptide (TPR) repeat protein
VRILLTLLLMLAWPTIARADWKVAKSEHFRLYGIAGAAELRAQAQLLEDFHDLLAAATGREPPQGAPPLDVFLVARIADASPWRRIPATVAGFYLAESNRISAVALQEFVDRRGQPVQDVAQKVLLHEYAHHFMLGASRAAYPAWYVEGFAEYFSTARFRPDRIEVGAMSPGRAQALANRPWLPMERLLSRDPSLLTGPDAGIFYAQSWLLTHYLFRVPGMSEKLQAYLAAFAAGEDPVDGFRRTVAPDLVAFEATLRTYLRRQASLSRVRRKPVAPSDVPVEELSVAAGQLLLPKAALEHGVPDRRQAAALSDMRTRTEPLGSDPLAARALALAELRVGSPERAVAMLDPLLEQAPDDAALLRWKADATLRLGRGPGGMAEARALLLRARSIDPTDWRTLHAYARLYRHPTRPMPSDVLDALLTAYLLAPQVTELALDAAVALTNADRLEEAGRVLEPLAWAPHQGPSSGFARNLLEPIRRGDKAGAQMQLLSVMQPRSEPQAARAPRARSAPEPAAETDSPDMDLRPPVPDQRR